MTTYAVGAAVMATGAGIVLLGFGAAPAEMAVALVAAQVAMAIHMAPQAAALLGRASGGDLVLRATAGAAVGLVATFQPSLRVVLLTLLLAVSAAGLVASNRDRLRALWTRNGAATARKAGSPGRRSGARGLRRLPPRAALVPAGGPGYAGRLSLGAGAYLTGLASWGGATSPPARAGSARRGPAPAGPPSGFRVDVADLKPPRWLPSYARAALTRTKSLGRGARSLDAAGRLRILFYHRIAAERDLLAVKPVEFERQMDLLAREGYTVLDVATAWDRFTAGDRAGRLIALSFDDGYGDFATEALPVLRRHGFTATVFVCPGLIDGTATMPWYRDPPALLSWDAIAALDGDHVRFEPHSINHPNLTALDTVSAACEIRESRLILEQKLGRPAGVFCYPGGLGGEREQALVRDSGLRLATTCEPGVAGPGANPFALPRTAVQRHDSLSDFRAKLAGIHDKPLPGRALYQRLRYGAEGSTT